MTIHDGKKIPLHSLLAPRARNRTIVLSPDLAERVRASVQGGQQNGPEAKGFGGAGTEDDGFVRPSSPIELPHTDEDSYYTGDRTFNSMPQSSPGSSSGEMMREPAPRTNPPGGVGAAQVRAAVQASQAPQSARPSQPTVQHSSERPVTNGVVNSAGAGTTMARPPLQSGNQGMHGNSGRDAASARSESSGGMRPAGGSTSAREVPPLGMPSNGAPQPSAPQTSMASLPRSTNYRGGNTEVAVVPTSLLLGFMVSFDENPFGEAFEIREGRTIISSDLPMSGGTVLLIEDPSVGSMHAVLKAESDGTLILLDQLSESGTFVRSQGGVEQQLSGDRAIVKHGDMVRFGSRSFKVILLD